MIKGGSDLLGSCLFQVGSFFFYPALEDVDGGVIGTWCFLIGSILFLISTSKDLDDVRQESSSTALNCAIAVAFVVGSILFVIGSYYFFPSVAEEYPSSGAWLFIIGSSIFILGSSLSVLLTFASSSSRTKPSSVRTLTYGANVCNILGCGLFIYGCVCFLPEYLLTPAGETDVTMYNLSVHCFVAGCVFFVLCSSMSVLLLYKDYTSK